MNKDAEIVAEGYNRIGAVYNEWSKRVRVAERDRYLRRIKALCPHGGKILDIGCGNGCSVASYLAKECQLVGIDVSEDGEEASFLWIIARRQASKLRVARSVSRRLFAPFKLRS